MLRAFDSDLWVAEQPLKYFGLEVGTRMTVIRLNDGKLMVISPISPEDATIRELDQLGKVRYIVSPNLYHHLFISQFKTIYPNAEIWASSNLKKKYPDLVIDRILSDDTIQCLDDIEAVQVAGFNTLDITGYAPLEEWVFFHAKSRTLIITDLAFHFDGRSSLTARLVSKLLGGYQQLRPSFLEKIATQGAGQAIHSTYPCLGL